MDRRRSRRWPRQLEVRFWKRGEEGSAYRAVASNISRTGIFIRTSSVLPAGSRLRLEVRHGARGFITEGVVARALKTPMHLQSAMPSGMGVRFLRLEELLEDLLPGVSLLADEAAEPEPPRGSPRAPSPVPQTPSGAPAAAAAAPPPAPIATAQVFTLRFRDREQFERAFARDIQTGGLFLSTDAPAPLDTVLQVAVVVDGSPSAPIHIQARVVHRVEPAPGEQGNLLAGMGVQFLDVTRAVAQLRALLET